MGILTKRYRLFWTTETKEMLNNYKDDYSKSLTMYPDSGPTTYFESDTYQDILNKIDTEKLVDPKEFVPPPIPEQPPLI